MLHLKSLGRIRLEDSAGGELLTGRRKELVLLCYLASRAGRPALRAELADLLWSDRPESNARHSLRQALSTIRAVVGTGLETSTDAVRLSSDVVAFDVTELRAHLAADRLTDAVALWRGDFLADADDLGGEAFREWLEAERESARSQLEWALQRLHAEAHREARWSDAALCAERWVELRPHDERAQLQLIDALHRSGRTGEALARHRTLAIRLRQDLGVEPSAEFITKGAEIESSVRAERAHLSSPGSAALFTPDLIGRDGAMAELLAAWRAVRSGASAIVLVEGEAGQGKTRLCSEFMRRLEREPLPPFVLRARGTATNTGTVSDESSAWATARELLDGLRAAPGLAGAPDRELAELSRLAPSLRTRFPRLPEPRGDERALPAALAQVLSDVAVETPVVVVIDDITAADRASQELISAFAERISAGVLLLASIAIEERPIDSPLSELYSAPHVRRLRLRPLDATDLEAVVASMLACPPDVRSALAQRLHAETGGNPLFATEILASLVDDGRLAPDAHGMWRIEPGADISLPLPNTVREAIRHRLQRLTPEARTTLAAIASVPAPCDVSRLAVATELSAEALLTAIDELVARRFIREDTTAAAHYSISHNVLRRVLLELEGIGKATSVQFVEPGAIDMRAPGARTRAQTRWRWAVSAAGLAVLVALVAIAQQVLPRDDAAAAGSPTLAVGFIRDYTGTDTSGPAHPLPEMLATNLARVPRLVVVSQARLYEISGQLGERALSPTTVAAAARRAGARELIEGELYATPGGGYRLDLRRIALATGAVLAAHRIDGKNVFALIDDATARVARDFGQSIDALHLADVTTTSLAAYRLYEEGLRAYYQGDGHSAVKLFRAAAREDSLFVLPAYYAVAAAAEHAIPPDSTLELRVLRLMDRAPERERLLMRVQWGFLLNDPAALAVAETLSIRYPAELDGHLQLGKGLEYSAQFLRALPHLRRVIEMDSLSLRRNSARCHACEAYSRISQIFMGLDSMAAAERVVREWTRRQPESAHPWVALSHVLEFEGRFDEAQAARRRAAPFVPGQPYDYVFPATLAIRSGAFDRADVLLRELSRGVPLAISDEARWFLVISLRHQGRVREALMAAHQYRAVQPQEVGRSLVEAQVLFEMGRYREAATLFRALDESQRPGVVNRAPGVMARHHAWYQTHLAAALAAAGDTAELKQLADSIEMYGVRSLYGRDRRLHHHVRGLLWSARGRHADAAEAFRRATEWPVALTSSYNRTNLELARALLALGRPQEAVQTLHLALQGPLESSNYYATRTELRWLLGRAHEAAGQRDSAAAHYRWTLAAWRNADPMFAARRDSVRNRLAAIERVVTR